jgi:hypothetical protein
VTRATLPANPSFNIEIEIVIGEAVINLDAVAMGEYRILGEGG